MNVLLHSLTAKVMVSGAVLGAAAGVAGLGTFGSFTSTTSASTTVASGTVAIALGTPGTASNRLTTNATGIVPGDTIQRAVTLTNSGNQDAATISITTAASVSSLLDTDATNGLQVKIDACSVPWTEAGSAPAYTYTCSGSTTSVLASRAVVTSSTAMATSAANTAGGVDNLVVTYALPVGAGNTFQNLSSTIGLTFTATQRAATNR